MEEEKKENDVDPNKVKTYIDICLLIVIFLIIAYLGNMYVNGLESQIDFWRDAYIGNKTVPLCYAYEGGYIVNG